ncbi:hypothetical protein F2Q68_00012207 [Brassica cretica]|uniref:Uncharacterized protein n=1 Tax=Brassica cretica TaxID=69181 RepID=A0A3N6PXJ9_BRACR|nr:hypothetical protein F2Q68_00012207 [Brassica cretica]
MDPNQTIGATPSGVDNVDPTGSNSRTETLPVGPTGRLEQPTHNESLQSEPRTRNGHQPTIDPHHKIALRFRKGPRSPIEPELESGIAPGKTCCRRPNQTSIN